MTASSIWIISAVILGAARTYAVGIDDQINAKIDYGQVQDTVLETAKETGLIVDLSLGPNQGAGVPAPADSDGLLWDLTAFNISIAAGQVYNDIIPGWGTGPLASASIGLVTSSTNTSRTLAASSLQDVTSQVGSTGQLELDLPHDTEGNNYTLFTYFLVHSEAYEQQSPRNVYGAKQSQPQTFVQNGSWIVDHFSAKGAQTTIDFWEQYLTNGSNTKQLLRQIGNYVWEDSMEYESSIYILWTPDLPARFLADRGYPLNKYLPIIYTSRIEPGFPVNPSYGLVSYVTDAPDGGNSIVEDYRQTVTEGYSEYLQTLSEWAESSLGLQLSHQVGYNLQVDMLAAIPHVNAPECETLGFNHVIDGYRQYAGPANLAGKRIISSECGAIDGAVYQQTIPELLWDTKRSVAGGVNNFIIHGYPYSGDYPNTTWPVFAAFDYLFSDMHGRHQPAWDFYSDFIDWTARTQYIAQSGIPKIDLAFWLKSTDYANIETMYSPTDLEQAGFSYEYLSPDNLNLPFVVVVNGTLAPERQAFKALILRANDTMTGAGVAKIAQFARQGLPVIFSGGLPSNISGSNATASSYINATLQQLTLLRNVYVVSYDNLAQSLLSLGIEPRTALTTDTVWYTYWREDTASSTDYIYIYNDATGKPINSAYSTGTVTFASTGIPFTYDAWTGAINPILSFTQTQDSTTIPLRLAGNQTTIIGFHNSGGNSALRTYVTNGANHNVVPHVSSGGMHVNIFPGGAPCKITLSNNTDMTFPPVSSTPIILDAWNLTIESWTRPSNLFDIDTVATKTNTSYTLSSLVSWSEIPGANLQNVSGRGYYSASFVWPSQHTAVSGAIIDLGAIIHSVRVSVNGHTLPPLDVTWAKADIGPYLIAGVNTVDVVVATPLGNALRNVWGDLLFSGAKPAASVPEIAEYGLVGNLTIVPYSTYFIGEWRA
ncbi:hypothetical protein MBLNU459_g0641t1 [Dothideomycetes sp. NU459]